MLVGKKYFSDGTIQSGVFDCKTRKLQLATSLDLPAVDGFLGMGTKLTNNQRLRIYLGDNYFYFGEYAACLLNGRGIRIWSNEEIVIQFFKDHHPAPGPYIYIWSDGTFEVGDRYYDANGALRARGTIYFTDGTRKFVN